jgi:hypothetical protein
MSLVSTAFPWINDDQPKKRTPAMNRKTIKTRPANAPDEQDYMIYNVSDIQEKTEDSTNRVTEIINQMSSVSVDNDGSKLADFTPPPNPMVQQRKPAETNLDTPLQMSSSPSYSNKPIEPSTTPFTNITATPTLGNYHQVYSAPPTSVPFVVNKPYYASMGLGSGDGKLLEKINYMIHMLENMESEKTANVTEEFVLYCFTGVFVIFVLDTFLKTGKYVR